MRKWTVILLLKPKKNEKHCARVGYKYLIKMPNSYDHTPKVDPKLGMKLIKYGESPRPDYNNITEHWVFDINNNTTRKASFF